jgi:peroxiredoxin
MQAKAATLQIGTLVPPLELPDTKGNLTTLPLPGEVPATVVFWTCNHCPYALAWHERLTDAARDYAIAGVRFLAINSNDAERHAVDSLEAMRERVANENWPFPYLRDEEQGAAVAWGPRTTPDLFVLDSELRLRYRGAPDADHDDPAQNAAWLRAALDAILANRAPEPAESESVGCSIKWKQ